MHKFGEYVDIFLNFEFGSNLKLDVSYVTSIFEATT